jgi:chaperonin GroES
MVQDRLKKGTVSADVGSIRPLRNRVVIQREASEDKSAGGLILPHVAREVRNTGRAIAVGPEVRDVRVGDFVLFGRYSAQTETHEEERIIVMSEDDIMAVGVE